MGWTHRSLLTALAVVVTAREAYAYPAPVDFDGSLMRWDVSKGDPAITYEIKADSDQDLSIYGNAVRDAAALWSNVSGSFFAYQEELQGGSAQVTVNLESALDGSAYSAGYAIFDEYSDKSPTHCSIFVVIDGGVSYRGLEKTFLHELGHCAGLGHTLIPEAIMSYSLDKNDFALDIDDEAALVRLYPVDGSNPKLPPGCAVGVILQGWRMSSLLWILLILPLAVAVIPSRATTTPPVDS